MRYRYSNPDDYAHAYAANPSGSRAEAESRRVMTIVQYVLDKAHDNERRTNSVFDRAKEQKSLKNLIEQTLKKFRESGLSDRALQVAAAGMASPYYVFDLSVDRAYYLDELAAEDPENITGSDPGVLVENVPPKPFPLGREGRRRKGGRRDRPRPFNSSFLKKVWPHVTDSDVLNAVRILKEEGVVFLRRKQMPPKEWLALRDPEASRYRYAPATIRSREEFLTAHARVSGADSVVLRAHMGAILTVLNTFDFAPDDVVYRYDGTNNSVGGASARGFYVAQLRSGQLPLEGMSPPVGLGICVGDNSYREGVESGNMEIYGIRTPGGKPKFTISVNRYFDTEEGAFSVSQIKGKANRLPGFDPHEYVFKGEAGVDDVRVVVEFLMNHLGMPAAGGVGDPIHEPQTVMDIGDLRPGLLAMQRIGIDPFSPPVKGQTWEATSVARERVVAKVNELWDSAANEPDEGRRLELLDQADALRRQLRQTQQMPPALDQMQGAMRRPAPRRLQALIRQLEQPRENPDPLSYTDPEVAALARAAYAEPMGGMWTYDDEDEDEE